MNITRHGANRTDYRPIFHATILHAEMSTVRTPSPFCHIVIPAPDLAKAKVFYETVFAWQVQANVPGGNYWFFETGNVGGAFSSSKKPAAQSTVLIVQVDDIKGTLAQIEMHGGTVIRERSRIGDASPGYDAYFLDPNGNEIGLYSKQ
jgi:uncharacterized protein